MLHLILKYAASHIYELHALLGGTLGFLAMFWVKKPLKREIQRFSARRAEESCRWEENRETYTRRMGLLLIATDLLLSGAFFGVLSVLSPFIHFSVPTMWLAGILSLTEYAVYDQLIQGRRKGHYE